MDLIPKIQCQTLCGKRYKVLPRQVVCSTLKSSRSKIQTCCSILRPRAQGIQRTPLLSPRQDPTLTLWIIPPIGNLSVPVYWRFNETRLIRTLSPLSSILVYNFVWRVRRCTLWWGPSELSRSILSRQGQRRPAVLLRPHTCLVFRSTSHPQPQRTTWCKQNYRRVQNSNTCCNNSWLVMYYPEELLCTYTTVVPTEPRTETVPTSGWWCRWK